MSEPVHEAVAIPGAPGVLRRRGEVPVPSGYAVFDCETTGTDPDADEIVSLALVLLDRDGVETGRFSSLVRPSCPIPEDATAIHGISDADVADAPTFAAARRPAARTARGPCVRRPQRELRPRHAPAAPSRLPGSNTGRLRSPAPWMPSGCSSRSPTITGSGRSASATALRSTRHDATSDALAAAALVRVLLERDLAPESARLDLDAFMRLRTRGDTRPASDPQIRRVFALARVAGLTGADGRADRSKVCELVHRVAGVDEPDLLTREQVQDVYDELDRLIAENEQRAAAV